MKNLIWFTLILLNIAMVSAFFSPFSILDVSDLGNVNIQINLTNKEDVFCLQNGNCTLDTLVVQGDMTVLGGFFNVTVTNIYINATTIVGLNDSIGEYGNDTYLRLDTANDPLTGDLIAPNFNGSWNGSSELNQSIYDFANNKFLRNGTGEDVLLNDVNVIGQVGIGDTPAFPLDITMTATDQRGIYIDGTTNDYTAAAAPYLIEANRDVNFGTDDINSIFSIRSTTKVLNTDATIAANKFWYLFFNTLDNDGSITNTLAADKSLFARTFQLTIDDDGTFDTDSTGKITYAPTAVEFKVDIDSTFKDTGGNAPASKLNAFGIRVDVDSTPTLESGDLTVRNYGVWIDVDGNVVGSSINYGLYFSGVSGADTDYVIWNNELNPNYFIYSKGGDVYLADGSVITTSTDNQMGALDIGGGAGDTGISFYENGSGYFDGILTNIGNAYLNNTLNVVNGKVGIGITTNLIDTFTVNGTMDLKHTATFSDDHAFEIEIDAAGFGDVKGIDIDYTTGAITTGQDEEAILVNIDDFLSTGGTVIGLEVITTEGLANVYGLEVGALVNPILQLSGEFSNESSATVNSIDRLTEFLSLTSDIDIFVNDDDNITIGSASKFEEIEFIFNTTSSGSGIAPTFKFSTGVGAWTEFNPTDGTNGMRNNGVVIWLDEDIPSWATSGGEYLIQITRTKNTIATNPIENQIRIVSGAIEYLWDKNGDLFVNEIRGNVLSGTYSNGEAYVCVYNNGTIFAKDSVCS